MNEENIIRKSVTETVSSFLQLSGGEGVTNLYEMVIHEMELGLFESTMKHSKGNQSIATSTLTMSRATLRKKLQEYDLLYHGK